MGRVFSAEHVRLARRVAIKVIRKSCASRGSTEQFLREARTLGKLTSRYVVRVLDADVADDEPFIVLELLTGRSLDQEVAAGASLENILQWVDDALNGLTAAHREGIVHRDIKPQNIFVAHDKDDPSGTVAKVVDFGIAKMIGGEPGDFTARGYMAGTPQFLSPEQIQGKAADTRSDVFSFGAMLYWLLTGTFPFETSDARMYPFALLTKTPRPIPSAKCSPELSAVVMRCLAKDPAQRYPNAEALRAAIRTARGLASRPSTQPPPPKGAAKKAAPAMPSLPLAVCGAGLILALAGFGMPLLQGPSAALNVEPRRQLELAPMPSSSVPRLADEGSQPPANLDAKASVPSPPRPAFVTPRSGPRGTPTQAPTAGPAGEIDQRPRVIGFSPTPSARAQ
jgi:serine/threonine-protein kinase